MNSRVLSICALLLFGCVSVSAADSQWELVGKLHEASRNLEQHTDREAVVESLYQKIRPRINVTNKSLSAANVDQIVRAYVSEKYASALIANYALLYSKLLSAKAEFSTNTALHPFNLSDTVIAVLCMRSQGDKLQVDYRTSSAGHDTGWTTSAIFFFTTKDDALTLSEIELQLKDDTKVYVDGI